MALLLFVFVYSPVVQGRPSNKKIQKVPSYLLPLKIRKWGVEGTSVPFLKIRKLGVRTVGDGSKQCILRLSNKRGFKLRPKAQYARNFRNHGVCLQEENPLSRPHMPLMFRLYASHHRVKIAMSRGSCELSGPSFSKSHAQPA